jgi:small subunit ribosomal protein S16
VSVKLRLTRVGKKKQPTYRIVAADSRSPRDGRFIEIVGTYAPRQEPSGLELKNDKVLDWLRKGAQPTERVRKLLEVSGLWGEYKGGASSSGRAAGPATKAPPEKAAEKAAEMPEPARAGEES